LADGKTNHGRAPLIGGCHSQIGNSNSLNGLVDNEEINSSGVFHGVFWYDLNDLGRLVPMGIHMMTKMNMVPSDWIMEVWGDKKRLFSFRYGLEHKNLEMIENNLSETVDFISFIDYIKNLENSPFKSSLFKVTKKFLFKNTHIEERERFLEALEQLNDSKEIHDILFNSLMKGEIEKGVLEVLALDSTYSNEKFHQDS
jgi:hypothetical protein